MWESRKGIRSTSSIPLIPARRRSLRSAFRLCAVAGWASLALSIASLASADPSITPDEGRNASAVVPHAPGGARNVERKLKLDYSTPPPMLQIVLPPPEQDEMKAMEQAGEKGPLVVGFHRDMPEGLEGDVAPRLEWIAQQDGSFVSVVSVTSPGAEALRVGLRSDPVAGIEIRFFSEQSDTRHPPLTSGDFPRKGDESAVLWSPTTEGDTIGIEIALPSAKAKDAFDTYGTLTGAGSAFRLENDDDGTDRNFLIATGDLPPGTYYLEVRGFDPTETGVYTLHVVSEGKWRLYVSGRRPLQVMGLMRTRSGHLSNLSR